MFWLCAVAAPLDPPFVAEGKDVKMIAYQQDGEWVEQLFAKDAKGAFRMIVASPNYSAKPSSPQSAAIQGHSRGLYTGVPDFHFTDLKNERKAGEEIVTFTVKSGAATIVKRVHIPATGRNVKIELDADLGAKRSQLHALLMSYVFVPDTKGATPDSTFLPGLRPKDDNVVGDHFFRAPVAVAQKGTLAALLMPDLDVLADNRPMETVIDLDAKSGVCNATLLTYGFCAHRLTGHVVYSTDSSMARSVPGQLHLAADLVLNAQAQPYGAYGEAVQFQWDKYGHRYFDQIKPQMMPFADYAKVCYPAVFNEQYGANKLGWFEVTIDGQVCGGVPSGWGFTDGWVSWQCWFNQLRSAWGLRWWGKKLNNPDWVDKADKMLNLALAAPMNRGACPTTYLSREKKWKGTLIAPDPKCYYDLTNMAWKGIWMLRWLEMPDCPRREEIEKQVKAMADLMVSKQNKDGSIPTWLDKDLNVIPVLDHSAQTALPAWFLAEADSSGRLYRMNEGMLVRLAAVRASMFLIREVVDQQRYYDFETFFSCSPKACLQRDGKLDDFSMHDSHALSPPQNTLCMQWTAEALNAVTYKGRKINGMDEGEYRPEDYRRYAQKALDIMALYQNVWPISYRKVAYTYGGFGVQNSDGEYNDARQAQFGCTMADFGAQTGSRAYFERGIAATRAAMTLINHPLHDKYGIYPNPNYPLGLQPENDGHGGTDHQAGRTGFDWGEGSGLASMAWLLEKYGPRYVTRSWAVLVDGGSKAIDLIKPEPVLVDPAWNFDDWRMAGWTTIGDFAETPTWSTRMNFGLKAGEGFIGTCEDGQGGFEDRFTGTLTSPKFRVSKPKIKLMVGGGSLPGTYVELLDADGKQVYVDRGKDAERLTERTWDVSAYQGKDLQIRIVDRETGGWGHINVARIRCGD